MPYFTGPFITPYQPPHAGTSGNFPGQTGNPVGFANTPAAVPSSWTGNGTWPGAYPGSLTTYGGGDIVTGGTSTSYRQFNFVDFVGGSSGQNITADFIKFIGCRFQCTGTSAINVNINSTLNGAFIEFYYCSFVPMVSTVSTPPGGGGYTLWPTGGTGKGVTPDRTDGSGLPNTAWSGFAIPNANGYQYGLICGGTPVLVDHCDFWGFANVITTTGTTGAITITDTWFHDCRYCGDTGADHTDGPGYLDGGVGPQNVTLRHNTITAGGVEDGVAWQANTAGYTNMTVDNNYLTGWDYALMLFTAPNSNVVISNNIFGTEVPWTILSASATNSWFHLQPNGNKWVNNTLKIYPGTSDVSQAGQPKWTSGQNGYFIYPDGTYNATDFV